jgi:hypothetical protein
MTPPEGTLRGTRFPVTNTFTFVPPTSMTSTLTGQPEIRPLPLTRCITIAYTKE